MSHIAEVYAKDLGVEIGRPYITDHFFPGLPDKYITKITETLAVSIQNTFGGLKVTHPPFYISCQTD